MASNNGTSFSGFRITGDWTIGPYPAPFANSNGWVRRCLDIHDDDADLSDRGSKWVAFTFTSDSSLAGFPGAYVDEVQIVAGAQVSSFPSISSDPLSGWQWALKNTGQTGGTANLDMRVPNAWTITTGIPSTIVAVVDDGVQLDHPDLVANLLAGIDETGGGSGGGPTGNDAHGTNVAGIIAAVRHNSVGVAGVAPNVRILPVRVFAGGNTTSKLARSGNPRRRGQRRARDQQQLEERSEQCDH